MSVDETNSDSRNENYILLKTDPEALLRLLNKYVKVQLIKNTEFHGFVHSIDPVHHSIILLVPEEDSYAVNIILGHAVLNVVETDSNYKPPGLHRETLISDDIDRRKQMLISWFKKNLLSITESGQKILFGNISILPPYGVSDVCTDNTVVAMQIRRLIQNMPDNFEPDKEEK